MPRRTLLAATATAGILTAVGCTRPKPGPIPSPTPSPAASTTSSPIASPTPSAAKAALFEYYPEELVVTITPRSDGTLTVVNEFIFDAGQGVSEAVHLWHTKKELLGPVGDKMGVLRATVQDVTATDVTTGTPASLPTQTAAGTGSGDRWSVGPAEWGANRHKVTLSCSVANVWLRIGDDDRLVINYPTLSAPWYPSTVNARAFRLVIDTQETIWKMGVREPEQADPTALRLASHERYFFLRPTGITAEPMPVEVQ